MRIAMSRDVAKIGRGDHKERVNKTAGWVCTRACSMPVEGGDEGGRQ